MKKLAFSVLATGSLALFIGVSDAEASSYTIKPGDTLWKIASSNNVSVANIKQWNNLNSDVIHPNQTLRLAAASTTAQRPSTPAVPVVQASTSNVTTYTVKSGDTLSRIAQSHKTTVSNIQKLNNISGHIIHPGQKLKVTGTAATAPVQATASPAATPAATPAPAASATSSSTYRVVSGDTLSAISHRHGVSVTQLMNWNNLTSSLIRVGQVLKIENATVAPQPNVKPVSAPVVASNSSTVNKLISTATSLTGTPYVWGGSTTRGFDCSGYIYYVFNQAGIKIPRTNTNGYDARSYEVSNPQVGDLVFFSNTYKAGISHMGIYIGDNKFIHAGGDRVQVTSLNDSYWGKKFDSFKRFYAQ